MNTINTSSSVLIKEMIEQLRDKQIATDINNFCIEMNQLTAPGGHVIPYMRKRVNHHLAKLIAALTGSVSVSSRDYDFDISKLVEITNSAIEKITNAETRDVVLKLGEDINVCARKL